MELINPLVLLVFALKLHFEDALKMNTDRHHCVATEQMRNLNDEKEEDDDDDVIVYFFTKWANPSVLANFTRCPKLNEVKMCK